MTFEQILDPIIRDPRKILPEFDFIEKADRWQSNNTYKISGRIGKTKGQVRIYKNRPYLLVDHSEESIAIFSYLKQRENLAKGPLVNYIKRIYGHDDEQPSNVPINVKQKAYIHSIKPIETDYTFLDFSLIRERIRFVDAPIPDNFPINTKDIKEYKKKQPSNLIRYFEQLLSKEEINKIIAMYYLGFDTSFGGSTVFWNIDQNFKLLRGKIMKYNLQGKRQKWRDGSAMINSIQRKLKKQGLLPKNSIQAYCYYGLHLIMLFPNKPIALFESEKTASFLSQFFTEYNCLATGSVELLKEEYYKVLKDKEIILYPDKGKAFEQWSKEAKRMWANGYTVSVSKFLEEFELANDKDDLLDVLY